jgi:hypothetical protein
MPTPIIFPDHVEHISVASVCGIRSVESAGFVDLNPVRTHGQSVSLDKFSRESDAVLIRALLGERAEREDVFEVIPKVEGVQ